eukprot:CAMPEP_0116843284 /NCGR_PEP_ID=MMETSP0418-20121206/12001_1 /TAXON_ID=1158023 /ORGANISM="Astrosyne radiata, Strain 13vi08-1A" /LENGTH=73 /DNA_ID=CAMNT_0004474017 /DNA_START=108 /DNA_END=326 /DNA_ORIENTATION=-
MNFKLVSTYKSSGIDPLISGSLRTIVDRELDKMAISGGIMPSKPLSINSNPTTVSRWFDPPYSSSTRSHVTPC